VVECLWNRRQEGADGAYCQGGQLCDAWNKCFTAAALHCTPVPHPYTAPLYYRPIHHIIFCLS
jgi:hypothetical protein